MSFDAGASRQPDCPSQEELAAYTLGKLSEELLERVAVHISSCQRCESTIQALHESDQLLSDLRGCASPEAAADPAGCNRLGVWAKGLADQLSDEKDTARLSNEQGTNPSTGQSTLPRRFGKYELLERLGKGGMGVVYKARHVDIGHVVALKLILSGPYAAPQDLERFRAEAKAVARLNHPNIIALFDYGEYDGQPYFTMELVTGGTLAARLAVPQPMPERTVVELLQTLAQAVQVAHKNKIVHRDLKPENILFRADGSPVISDFGLAKLLDATDGPTATQAIVGTASYMAPEQAWGKPGKNKPAADVYSLGAILYELLCGQPPFRGANKIEILEQVRTKEPIPPTRVRPGVSGQLETICLRCLEKRPSQRYESAAELAEDLGRWLRDEWKPTAWWHRVARALRRRPVAYMAILLAMFVPLFGPAAVTQLDPDRPLKEIEKKLVRGEKVTLIGETGAPAWSQIRTGGAQTHTSYASDGTFSVHSWDHLCLVKLADVPNRNGYELRAQVRHEQCGNQSKAGLYFAGYAYPCEGAEVHLFIYVAFNDIEDARTRMPVNPLIPPGHPIKTNKVFFKPHLFAQRSGHIVADDDPFDLSRVAFFPAGRNADCWRTLVVKVATGSIQVKWEGEQFAATMPTEKLASDFDAALWRFGLRQADSPSVLQLYPDLPRGGALGCYVERGSVSYRGVTVQPLPD